MSETNSISYWTGPKIIIRLTYALKKIRQPKDFVGYHIHPANELILVKTGILRLRNQNRQWVLGSNTFFAVPSSTRHEIIYLEKNTQFINIMFRGSLFDPLILTPLALEKKEWDIAESLVKNSIPPIEPVHCELAVAQLITLLCMLTLRNNAVPNIPIRIPINRKLYKSKIVLDAIEYMEEHSTSPLTLTMVAKHVGISSSHLRHMLLQETGYGFSAHLLQHRVEKVKKMISESDANIKNIANECGFNSIAFFYKVFKRYTGMTPLEYAKSLH